MAVEPGGLAGQLLVEFDDLGGLGLNDGDEGDDHGHEEDGQLRVLHDEWMWLFV